MKQTKEKNTRWPRLNIVTVSCRSSTMPGLLIQLVKIVSGAYWKPSFSVGQILDGQSRTNGTAHWLKDEYKIIAEF